MLSPLRRSQSTSSLLPVLIDNNNDNEEEVLISESNDSKLPQNWSVSVDDLTSPLQDLEVNSPSSANFQRSNSQSITLSTSQFNTPSTSINPLSPLSHVKSKIEYVEELMSEHESFFKNYVKLKVKLYENVPSVVVCRFLMLKILMKLMKRKPEYL